MKKKIITIFVIVFLSLSTFAQNVELSNKLIEKYKNGQANALRKDAFTRDKTLVVSNSKKLL